MTEQQIAAAAQAEKTAAALRSMLEWIVETCKAQPVEWTEEAKSRTDEQFIVAWVCSQFRWQLAQANATIAELRQQIEQMKNADCNLRDKYWAESQSLKQRIAELTPEIGGLCEDQRRLRERLKQVEKGLIRCASVLEALWAAEHDGDALCGHMKDEIRAAIEIARATIARRGVDDQ